MASTTLLSRGEEMRKMASNDSFLLISLAGIALPCLLVILLLFSSPQAAFSEAYTDDEVYFLDSAMQTGSKFLGTVIKKGAHCDPTGNNICNAVAADRGTAQLHCCNMHCRNVLGDRNNCGQCGQRCGFGQLCCDGACTAVTNNVNHCGKCNRRCRAGLKCDYGFCGYA